MPIPNSLGHPTRLPLITVIALCGLASACSSDDSMAEQPDATPGVAADAGQPDARVLPRETVTETRSLEPGELIEGILAGGAGDTAIIHLEAPNMELDWNIHGHADGSTQTIYEELNQMTVDYTFAPEAEADWYLLLRNSGTEAMDVDLNIELYGEITWEWL